MKDGHGGSRLRASFLGWQCRIREHAVRHHGGRPSPGMRPRVVGADGAQIAAAVTVLLIPAEPAPSTALFRHIARKTHDPERRYRDAAGILSSDYFQNPEDFSDVLTALFALDSPVAASLSAAGRCVLAFEEAGQGYRLPCSVARLAADHPAHQATYWHNLLFNPAMPGAVTVLAYTPDWPRATMIDHRGTETQRNDTED